MKKLKLCNVHKLAFANEGDGRKPIHIPFGTWAYDGRPSHDGRELKLAIILDDVICCVARRTTGVN